MNTVHSSVTSVVEQLAICDPSWTSQEISNAHQQFTLSFTSTYSHGSISQYTCSCYHWSVYSSFFVVLVISCFQLLRFFLYSSNWSYQKGLYVSFIAISAIRVIRHFYLSTLDPFEIAKIPYSTPQIVIADLSSDIPSILSLTSLTLLILYWEHLFDLVYARSKLQSPKLLTANREEFGQIQQTFLIANASAFSVSIMSRIIRQSINNIEPIVSLRDTLIPMTHILASFVAIFVFFYRMSEFKSVLKGSYSVPLKKLTNATFFVCAIHCLSITLAMVTALNWWNPTGQSSLQVLLICNSIWRALEILQIVIQLFVLSSPDLTLLSLPLEKKPDVVWLTSVLQHAGAIDHTTQINSIDMHTLAGGCHYTVYKIDINEYSNKQPNAPKTVVCKILSWNKSLLQKITLSIKKSVGYPDLEAFYLTSYQIEAGFYNSIANKAKMFKIPCIYFNLEDCFNNKFGMVMQFLEATETGQPNGFSFEDARILLIQLAKFHASNWNFKASSYIKLWDIGGYWTGNKREANKSTIKKSWEQFVENFKAQLPMLLKQSTFELGRRLDEKLSYISAQFKSMTPVTVIHGDYKVSNIMINKSEKNSDQQVCVLDWQWMGFGSPAIDIVHFLATSIQADHLHRTKQLMKLYHSTLVSYGVTNYPFEKYRKHFHLSWIDYCMYCVVSKWASMKPANIVQYQQEGKDGLHLRSFHHIKNLVEQTEIIMDKMFNQESIATPDSPQERRVLHQ